MSVKAIRLENFMAFADTGWIELRPITLLFGRNSSGKSAIIRALRLLSRNLEQPTDDRYTLRFTSEYGVDLGGYVEAVHNKNRERVMRFHFRCDVPEAVDAIRQEINQWRRQENLPAIVASKEATLTLTLAFGYDPHRETELIGVDIGCNWQITTKPGSHRLLSAVWLDQETRYEVGYNWWLDSDLPTWQTLDWQAATFNFPQNFLPQLLDSPASALRDALDNLAQNIATFLKGIEYQPPIRPEPQRVYLLDEVARQRWRQQGWTAFVDFLEGNKLDDPTETRIDSWLQTLELGERIEPPGQYREKEATVSKITIKEKESGLLVNLKNTGFGASQVIPIIVQSVTARQRVEEKTAVCVVTEQPELHLHPRAQADLADLFVDEIYEVNPYKRDSEGKPEREYRSVKFLIETHSEHLFLRFRRRIAETFIGKQIELTDDGRNQYLLSGDLAVYFVDRNHKNSLSSVEEMLIGNYGDFIEPPAGFNGFFSDDLKETLAITRAKLEAPE